MKKTIICLFLSIAMLFGLTGCSGNENSVSDSLFSEPSDNRAIHIKDIDWNVAGAVLDGERIVSFNYTNKSKYTILGVELKFSQKEGITAEQLSVFDGIKKECELTDEEVAEIYIIGSNRKCADPGETVTNSPCRLGDIYEYVQNLEQYELMEPDIMEIYYIADDGKGHTIYYDFKTDSYSESSNGSEEIQEWSDSELGRKLPKAEAPEIKVDIDDENKFMFTAHGLTIEEYESYIEAVKSNGFSKVMIENSKSFFASNADGEKVDLSFDSVDEEMRGSIYKV